MDLKAEHIKGKPKKVGHVGNASVFHVETTGGYHMMIATRNGKTDTLGVGPHPVIAKHIAKKREKAAGREISFTELNKSDDVPYEAYSQFLPKYENETDRFRAVEAASYEE